MDCSLLDKNIYKSCLLNIEKISLDSNKLNFKEFDLLINEEIDIDDFLIITRLFSITDVKKAKLLLKLIFSFQKSDGSLPNKIKHNNSHIYHYAPKPYISYISKIILNDYDNDLAIYIIPKLRKYISWMVNYFDPQKKGIYFWRNKNEALFYENWKENEISADLFFLLLSELESLKFIQDKYDYIVNDNYELDKDIKKIINNIEIFFWDKKKRTYSNKIIGNVQNESSTELFYLPLLCENINYEGKEIILEKLRIKNYISKYIDLNDWREIDLGNQKPKYFEKLLFFESLQQNELHGELSYDYLRFTINGINQAYKKSNVKNISIINSVFIFIINNFFLNRYMTENNKLNFLIKFLKKAKIDRLDLAILFLVLISILSIYFWNGLAKIPPPLGVLDAEINNAYVHYDREKAIEIFNIIEKYYPTEKYEYQLYIINLAIFNEQYNIAMDNLIEVRNNNIDSPGPMLTEAILLHLQNNFTKAYDAYYEFCYLFNDIFPDIVSDVKIFMFLSKENLKLPSNWKEIYKYRLLHEI